MSIPHTASGDTPLSTDLSTSPQRVATAAGEAMRLRALGLLESEYKILAARAGKRQPSSYERSMLNHHELALEALQAMGPGNELDPTDAIGRAI